MARGFDGLTEGRSSRRKRRKAPPPVRIDVHAKTPELAHTVARSLGKALGATVEHSRYTEDMPTKRRRENTDLYGLDGALEANVNTVLRGPDDKPYDPGLLAYAGDGDAGVQYEGRRGQGYVNVDYDQIASILRDVLSEHLPKRKRR